ncbi:MAG: glycosyltransferase family 2 protein [Bacteroidales bacterium]|nr:glycosyltransferase family 2 protein [Bacteroidales bacterium]
MNKLSVVIITYNEERNIARCIESIHTIADEVVVVDSFSTDATPQICQRYGVRFVSHEWEGYIKQKNYANTLASNDLILSLDADEAVSEELLSSITALKTQNVEKKVFSMNRLMNYCGTWIHHGGWYPENKIRVFDRRYVYWVGQKVHETLFVPEDYQVIKLDGDLLHYSYYTVEEHRRQFDKFSTLSSEEMLEKGKNPSIVEAYLHGFWRFVRDYIFKLGFLDGKYGWIVAKINAKYNFMKYKKTIDARQRQK